MKAHPSTSILSAAVLIVSLLSLGSVTADVPHEISYQGRLLDDSGTPVPDGLYDITFTIYDQASGGNELWSSGSQVVSVTDGLFTHALGSSTPLPDSLFDSGSDRYLGVQVEADPELAPRTRLLSSAYALHARSAEQSHVFRLIPQDTPGACDAGGRGEVYYDSSMNEPCYCTGTGWVQLDGGGLCECPDLDSDGYDGCDAAHPKDTDGLPADCDDSDASRNPGQPEIACNGKDDDCDGVDEGTQDLDGDGYTSCAGDCDDFDPNVNPGATELCNTVDDDCNGTIDDNAADAATFYVDLDGDGYGDLANPVVACTPPPGYVADNTDCNDFNPTIHPGATEVCDSQDNDCDGQVDEGVGPIWYRDFDSDGWGTSAVTVMACTPPPGYVSNQLDCDDNNSSVHPGAPEICDGTDNNCNGQTDENPIDGTTWYRDLDGDGFGSNVTQVSCTQPPGYVANNLDCNDNNAAVNPAASEVCGNSIDDDCDGSVDEGC